MIPQILTMPVLFCIIINGHNTSDSVSNTCISILCKYNGHNTLDIDNAYFSIWLKHILLVKTNRIRHGKTGRKPSPIFLFYVKRHNMPCR